MKTTPEEIFKALGEVNPEWVVQAEALSQQPTRRRWLGWSLAAALSIILGIVWLISNQTIPAQIKPQGEPDSAVGETEPESSSESSSQSQTEPGADNPEATNQTYNELLFDEAVESDGAVLPQLATAFQFEGMGYEGLMAHDIAEIISPNPWREDWNLSQLPVFYNPKAFGREALVSAELRRMMSDLIEQYAQILGIEYRPEQLENSFWQDSNAPWAYGTMALEDDNYQLSIDTALVIHLSLKQSIMLPSDLPFNLQSTAEEMSQAGYFIKPKLEALLGLTDLVVAVSGGDYNIAGERSFRLDFYPEGQNPTDALLKYFFRPIHVSASEPNQVSNIWIHHTAVTQKIADYPILSPAEAARMLQEGRYITSVRPLFEVTEFARMELVYRVSESAEIYLPYYRFFVALPEEGAEIPSFGTYYVPAIRPEHVSDLMLWDGSIN